MKQMGGTAIETFPAIAVSSKFAICGLPIRVDSYNTCDFGCTYCFANHRVVMGYEQSLKLADVGSLKRKLERVLGRHEVQEGNFLDYLLADGITWHHGGMSDPFQRCESTHHITRQIMELTKEYGIHVLYSTKTDDLRGCEPDPSLHTFQLSVSNVDDRRDIERGVPPIAERKKLFDRLKSQGFKVGIRVQPFIPGISGPEIADMFSDADQFTIEGLKLVPQNREHKIKVLDLTGLDQCMFVNDGLLNLREDVRLNTYGPLIEQLDYYAIPWSIADNDMHHLGLNRCCCGDALVDKSTDFNNTALCYDHGRHYSFADVMQALGGARECRARHLFTSNRTNGCVTVEDFYRERFGRKSSPFSPQFLCDVEDVMRPDGEQMTLFGR